MNDSLILFTRSDCGLCNLASSMIEDLGLTVRYQDIAGNLDLLEAYGHRIPVLKYGEEELGWPFKPEGIQGLISASGQ